MPQEKQPPLGIVPRWRHSEIRIKEILDAIGRYTDGGKVAPKEWLQELTDLSEWLREYRTKN